VPISAYNASTLSVSGMSCMVGLVLLDSKQEPRISATINDVHDGGYHRSIPSFIPSM
jgi:hypothetical protein